MRIVLALLVLIASFSVRAVDDTKALAEQGNAKAQFNLGVMYDNGQGTPQDYKEALKWYKAAAAQGDANAQINLGLMYENGQGVTQDYKEAARLYGLAAAQGDALAQYNLGGMYYHGQGVIRNKVYAHMWWNLAASSGDADAIKSAVNNRDYLAKGMTASQLETAQELARDMQNAEFTIRCFALHTLVSGIEGEGYETFKKGAYDLGELFGIISQAYRKRAGMEHSNKGITKVRNLHISQLIDAYSAQKSVVLDLYGACDAMRQDYALAAIQGKSDGELLDFLTISRANSYDVKNLEIIDYVLGEVTKKYK